MVSSVATLKKSCLNCVWSVFTDFRPLTQVSRDYLFFGGEGGGWGGGFTYHWPPYWRGYTWMRLSMISWIINDKCNICSRYCIYHVKFTSYCELIELSRPIRFFIVSLMYNNTSDMCAGIHISRGYTYRCNTDTTNLFLFLLVQTKLRVFTYSSLSFRQPFLLSTWSFNTTTLNRYTALRQHVALLRSIATTDKWASSSYLAGAYQWLLAVNSSLYLLGHRPFNSSLFFLLTSKTAAHNNPLHLHDLHL